MPADAREHDLVHSALWPDYQPIIARSKTIQAPITPAAYDCVKLTFIRHGSAILLSEFGQKPIRAGDVVLLGANTLGGSQPEGNLTVTTIYADTDYLVDQVYWQYVGILEDRLDANNFAATIYTERAQILRLGERRAEKLMPWLDELVALSVQGRPVDNFYRMQALWFSIAHVIAPFVKTTQIRISPTQRATNWPTPPRHRRFAPLRIEARRVAQLLRADPERHWSVADLANEVHLSKSQLGRVFVEAYGKSPIAFLTMLRAERIAGLLRTTSTPIAVIAQAAGWSDPDFAARQFRRYVGVTPSQYRNMSRACRPTVRVRGASRPG